MGEQTIWIIAAYFPNCTMKEIRWGTSSLKIDDDAWGWCTAMTQRDGMGREEGGGFRMGNTCILWWIHFYIWQNQYNNVKLKNKIK